MKASVLAATLAAMSGLSLAAGEASAQRIYNIDWLVIQPEVGMSFANVYAFNNNNLIPGYTESRVVGPRFGGTVGMRFGPLTVGAHADLARYTPFDIGNVGARVELRLPLIAVQPFVRVGAGYSWLGQIDPRSMDWTCAPDGPSSSSCPSIRGWHVAAGGGLDITLTRHFTVGGALDLSVLNLTRGARPTTINFQQTGDSVGIQATLSIHGAVRFN